MKQWTKGFTLVEMLIVIAIVAILAFVGVSSYGAARQQARRDIAIDSLVSSLRGQQGLAKSGRLQDDSEGNRCFGMLFSTEEPYAQTIETAYVPVGPEGSSRADYCDEQQREERETEALEDFQIFDIELFGGSADSVVILFKPPFARIVLTDAGFGPAHEPLAQTTPDIVVRIGLPNETEQSRALRIDTSSGLIERVYEQPSTNN